jgi:hypothetical protein
MKTYLGVGVTVLLSSIAFAQTAPLTPTITLGTTSLVINNSMRTLALVTDPTYSPLTASQLPDFGISVSAPAQAVQGGQSLGASILITPENGFSEKLSLSCSGLPSGASCVFGSPLAQAGGSFIIPMTISTKPASSAIASSTTPLSVPVYMAFPLVVFLLSMRRNDCAKYMYRSLGLTILAVVSLGWLGCGGNPAPIPVISTITITAQPQSGLSHNTQITIEVFG